jgi:hypothetical protein
MKILPPAGSERRRQLRWLTMLLLALVAVLWYQWGPAEPTAPASNSPVQAGGALRPLRLPESIKLEELEAVPERAEVGRNPFGFGTAPAPPQPAVTYTPPPPPVLAPPAPQGPPPIVLKLTAMIVIPTTGRTMVTLKDAGSGALFQAFEGDVVDGRYRVVKVGTQSVVLSYVDGSGTRTVTLGG